MKAMNSTAPTRARLRSIEGMPPLLINVPDACRFSPRCVYAHDVCLEDEPALCDEFFRAFWELSQGRRWAVPYERAAQLDGTRSQGRHGDRGSGRRSQASGRRAHLRLGSSGSGGR